MTSPSQRSYKIDAHVTSHSQCPECAKLGKDNAKDNLATYSDGHSWCYSCGYYVAGNRLTAYIQKTAQPLLEVPAVPPLPHDCDTSIPTYAREWFYQYELDHFTLAKHNILWSEFRKFLIFPYFINGVLIGWQGRYFGDDKSIGKWHTKGKPETFIYTLGSSHGKTLVLTEDIVSAIKVSRLECCSPIFGSVINSQRFVRLSKFYENIIIWLDPDKQKEALKFANKGRLFGLNCSTIMSTKDPKEHTLQEIESYLHDKTRSRLTLDPPTTRLLQ